MQLYTLFEKCRPWPMALGPLQCPGMPPGPGSARLLGCISYIVECI